jgi:periplasmic protein TonB
MFDILIESNPGIRPKKTLFSLIISIILHTTILMVAIITPLFFTDTLNPQQLVMTYLVAPPPPPPPPPPPLATTTKAIKSPKVQPQEPGKMQIPISIPREVALVVDEGPPPEIGAVGGVEGGVPGGVPGGTLGGVLGGVLGGALPVASPPPPPPPAPKVEVPKVKTPVRVGGKVRSPHILRRIEPMYPPLARNARIQGTVTLEATLTEQGRVADLKFVSGHPLLIQSAMDAARQWQYEPTYLNDVAYPVVLYITVNFVLQ